MTAEVKRQAEESQDYQLTLQEINEKVEKVRAKLGSIEILLILGLGYIGWKVSQIVSLMMDMRVY